MPEGRGQEVIRENTFDLYLQAESKYVIDKPPKQKLYLTEGSKCVPKYISINGRPEASNASYQVY